MLRRGTRFSYIVSTVFLVLFGFFFLPRFGLADSFMYMDESGNIRFAEKVSLVPEQYREQVVKPTPVDLDQKEYKKLLKEQEKKREQAKKEKAKKEAAEKKKALKLRKKKMKEAKRQQRQNARVERQKASTEKF